MRMRRGGGRHRFTLVGRKLVKKPAKADCMNIHGGGDCLASVGLACLAEMLDTLYCVTCGWHEA